MTIFYTVHSDHFGGGNWYLAPFFPSTSHFVFVRWPAKTPYQFRDRLGAMVALKAWWDLNPNSRVEFSNFRLIKHLPNQLVTDVPKIFTYPGNDYVKLVETIHIP